MNNYFEEISPSKDLEPFIRCFWQYTHIAEDKAYTILPNGCFHLLFFFRNKSLYRIRLFGLHTEAHKVLAEADATIYAIRLYPVAVKYLFAEQTAKQLLNDFTDLDLQLWNISEIDNGFDNFISEISDRIIKDISNLKIDNREIALFQFIFGTKPIFVKDVADELIWSSRQLNRYFNTYFNIPLKTYLKIIRCNSLYSDFADGNLYPDRDYSDQAHLIREVKTITKSTPKKLHKNENDRFFQLWARERE